MSTPSSGNNTNKLFVIDTNVLIHDPYALWQFEEHDIFIPMVVVEELDNLKKGATEMARNVRHASHFLDDIIKKASYQEIIDGIPLGSDNVVAGMSSAPTGKIFFQTMPLAAQLPVTMASHKPDNSILAVVLALQQKTPERQIILVTKDTNLRIKATIVGVVAQDYFNDQVVDDLSELRSGVYHFPKDFWEKNSKALESWQEEGRSFYKINSKELGFLNPNDAILIEGDEQFLGIVRKVDSTGLVFEYARDYSQIKHAVWGINARNVEQTIALNHLMDPTIDLVTLQGTAGTGKTLLALASALQQTIESRTYSEIIMTRVTIPLGEDIGFLPGTEEEKMTPWMGGLMDNLEVLHKDQKKEKSTWEKEATLEILNQYLKVRSLNFMRGRTFLNKFLIIDEAQNLTSKQLKTLITRAGPQTKIVILGDLKQIDTPYLNEVTSGFTYVIDRFKNCPFAAHVTLVRGERSRLSEYAANVL